MTGKIVWAYVTYCLLSTADTVVNIPLNTIVSRLTSVIHEWNCLVSSRMICALLRTALVMSITMSLVNFFGQGDTQKGFLITMSLYGIGAMLLFVFTFMNTKEVIPPSIQPGTSSFKNDLKGINVSFSYYKSGHVVTHLVTEWQIVSKNKRVETDYFSFVRLRIQGNQEREMVIKKAP